MPRGLYTLALLLLLLSGLPAAARDGLPAGFVYLRDIDPSIAQDMRYASPNNFTSRPLPGYGAAECVLRRDVAQALGKVQADLARRQLGLKTYDCYRPARAVTAFLRWSRAPEKPGAFTKRFYPALDKRTLFASGYIATTSAHSAGTAVDLTLIPLPAPPAAPYDRAAAYGACTAPAGQRAPDTSLDMGTGFDCFDEKSHTASAAITQAQKHWRGVLLAVMRAHGFHNYAREWWHFSYGARPREVYDFPVAPR